MTSDNPTPERSDERSDDDFAPGLGNIPPAAHDDSGPPRRRRWPWIVGAIVLGLAGLVAAGPSLISSSWLNNEIRTYLNENLEDGTAVDFGNLDVSWSEGIRLTDLAIRRSMNDPHPLLHAPIVEFDADVWPLLIRQLNVRKFVFHDPVVRIERTREGTLNTEDVVKTHKKKKRGDDGEVETLVLPEIDVPIEVHGLKLVLVSEDGREVERDGIEFSGRLATRKGPTTFALHVPSGNGVMDATGDLTLFDSEGALLPVEELVVISEVRLSALDAAENRDLLGLFMAETPTAGLLDGHLAMRTKGRIATGDLEITVRNVTVGDGAAPDGEREDLRITGAFETDGKRFTIRDGLVLAEGLEARAAFAGTASAIDGKATVQADLAKSADALRAMGIDVPAGIAGRVSGDLTFTPSPSRGVGNVTFDGLRMPAANEGGEPLAIDRLVADLVFVPGADAVVVERVEVRNPNELVASLTGRVGHDGGVETQLTVDGQVPAIVRRAKAMGLVPEGVALAGAVDGRFALARSAEDGAIEVTIESAALRDEGVLVEAAGTIGGDGAMHLRVNGEGAIERLLAAGGADERLRALKGTFSFAATANGPADALAAELKRFRIDGDLALGASGRMRADGRIEGSATLDGRIADAIALARGFGFVEGELPLDGRIHGDVTVAGSRDRPEVPTATLKIDDGPVVLDVAGSITELGTLQATFDGTAQIDALLRVAHAQGALARTHAPGGEIRILGVVAGTREKPEVPKATMSVSGPLTIRADGSLDDQRSAHVRVDLSGALQPLAALMAAVEDGETQPIVGAYEGALSIDGPLDGLQMRLSKMLIRSEGLTVDASAALRPGGTGDGAIAIRGPLEGAFAIAHAFGQLPEVSGTGTVDVALDARVTGSESDRLATGSLTGTLHDLVMLRADAPEAIWQEERVSFSVPSFSHSMGTDAANATPPPIPFAMDTASGVRLTGRVSGGTGGAPIDLQAELKGPVQPLVDASAVFTGGGAGVKIGGSIATSKPLVFQGDVSAGRDGAAGWTGGTVIEMTDIVAPYVAVSTGSIELTIAKGQALLDPIAVAINGGTANGTATIGLVGEKPEHAIKLSAKDVRIDADLAPLLAHAAPILAVGDAGDAGGKAGIDVDLTAKGLDGDKLRGTLNGNGVMHLDGVYAESRNWIGKLLDFAGAGTRLEFATADVPFTVKRGKVTTENVDLAGKGLNLRLGGEVGLADGTIDYAFGVKPAKEGGKLEKYAKLFDDDGYLPLRLKGALANPDLKLPSISDAVKGGLGGLLDDVLGRDKDKEEEERKKAEKEEARRKRRAERKRRKAAEAAEAAGEDPPPDDAPPDDGADNPR